VPQHAHEILTPLQNQDAMRSYKQKERVVLCSIRSTRQPEDREMTVVEDTVNEISCCMTICEGHFGQ
jgi:hypothetical protein